MPRDAAGFKKIYIAAGRTDLRKGIEGLAAVIKLQFHLEPRDRNTLFLFCGTRTDRIKGLLWEGDGWLLLYKRIEAGGFCWPRTTQEALAVTQEQFQALMQGLEIVPKRPIRDVGDPPLVL